MSFINKVKNFFYEEVEDDEEYELNELRKREEKERKREEKLREKQRKAEERELLEKSRIEKPVEETKTEDLSERELFKSEKTFNFPMDVGDNIFDDTEVVPVEEIKQEEKRLEQTRPNSIYSTNVFKREKVADRYDSISKYQKEDPNEPKKFKPTPVVSPIYGILDKNYTVDDVVDKNLSKTKEFSIEKTTVDFDSVRNRAYKELDEEIERTLTGKKDIFYNLDSDDSEEKVEEEYSEDEYKLDEDDNSEVVITYDDEIEEVDIPKDEEKEEFTMEKEETEENNDEDDFEKPDVEIPVVKKRASRKSKKVEVEEDNDEKEDLFNLIDNMYKDDDEEEDD